jgi:hypothetical protein
MHESPKPKVPDLFNDRKVTVEIGVGDFPDRTILDKLADTSDVESGKILHVSIDKNAANLQHVKAGAVSKMSLHEFANGDFLDGVAEKIYIFNVFGDATARGAEWIDDDALFLGLKKKLAEGGTIIVGEHITPEEAKSLKDPNRFRQLGFEVEMYDKSHIAIDARLERLGFSKFSRASFVNQSVYNKSLYGEKGEHHMGFLLLLRKKAEGRDIR